MVMMITPFEGTKRQTTFLVTKNFTTFNSITTIVFSEEKLATFKEICSKIIK